MRNKKIAFVIAGLESGGAERVVSTLANELCEKYDITVITLWDVQPFYTLDPKINHISCVSESLISNNVYQAIRNNFRLLRRLKIILKEERIDLTIGFTTTSNILAVMGSKFLNIPCIISERSNPRVKVLGRFWSFLRKKYYRKSDYLVVQTNDNFLYYSSYILKDRIKILANPLSKELTKHKNLSTPREQVILSVGRLDKNKSQDLLINAFSNIEHEGWQIIIVGDGVEKDNYLELVRQLGLEDKVTFTGNSSNVFDYYNSSSLFAFTSKSEGFPNVLIEAMYFELPCISTDCPNGPSEIINDGSNGYLIPVNDQKALEEKLTLLMSSQSLRENIGSKAYQSAKHYLTDNIVAQWEVLIKELI